MLPCRPKVRGVCVRKRAGQRGKGCRSHMAACLWSHCWQARLSWMYWRTSHSMVLLFRSSSRACFTCSYTLAPAGEKAWLNDKVTQTSLQSVQGAKIQHKQNDFYILHLSSLHLRRKTKENLFIRYNASLKADVGAVSKSLSNIQYIFVEGFHKLFMK